MSFFHQTIVFKKRDLLTVVRVAFEGDDGARVGPRWTDGKALRQLHTNLMKDIIGVKVAARTR
jgi:hypothetical protein